MKIAFAKQTHVVSGWGKDILLSSDNSCLLQSGVLEQYLVCKLMRSLEHQGSYGMVYGSGPLLLSFATHFSKNRENVKIYINISSELFAAILFLIIYCFII